MAIKDVASGRGDLYKLDPKIIQIKEGWNSREATDPQNSNHIAELAASIKEVGVKKPLVCYMENEVVYVTDGHCRLQAVMHLIEEGVEIKTVPVIVEDRHANEADRIFSQIVHNAGKPLTSLEQAKVFKRLVDLGWKQQEIAAKAGISGGRVSQLLELLILPAILQKYIIEGKASASMVLNIYKKHDQNVDETIMELNGAVKVAQEQGRTRAMPKDTGEEGTGASGASKSGKSPSIKAVLKEIIEDAARNGSIDDSEDMVTITMTEESYRAILDLLGL